MEEVLAFGDPGVIAAAIEYDISHVPFFALAEYRRAIIFFGTVGGGEYHAVFVRGLYFIVNFLHAGGWNGLLGMGGADNEKREEEDGEIDI